MNLRFPHITYDHQTALIMRMEDLDDPSPAGELTFVFEEDIISFTDKAGNEYAIDYKNPELRSSWHIGALNIDHRDGVQAYFGEPEEEQKRLINGALSCAWTVIGLLSESGIKYALFKETNNLIHLKASREKLIEAFETAKNTEIIVAIDDKKHPDLEGQSETMPDAIASIAERYREAMGEEETRFKKNAKNANDTIQTALQNIRDESTALESKIQELMGGANKRLVELKETHNQELVSLTRKANIEYLDMRSHINDAGMEIDDFLKTARTTNKKLAEKLEESEAKEEEILSSLNITKQQIEKLAQIRSEQALTDDFEKASDRAEKANWIWTAAFFLTGVLTIVIFGAFIFTSVGIEVYGVKIYTPPIREGIDWTRLLQRISITAVLAYILVYTGNQAAKQRNYEKYFSRLSMELKALDAYIAPYSPEKKLEFKEAFMHMYFGKVTAPLYEKESAQPSMDFLSVVSKLAENRKKDEEDKAEAKESKEEAAKDAAKEAT